MTHPLLEQLMDNVQLATHGIRAYQSGEFPAAVGYLGTLKNREPKLWRCRFYLAIAYWRVGEVDRARRELIEIAEHSSDQSIRKEADEALSCIDLKVRGKNI
jgi:Flp pilus assembly protein TadD